MEDFHLGTFSHTLCNMKLLRLVLFFVLTLVLPSLGLAAIGTTSGCSMMGMSASVEMPAMSTMDCSGMDMRGLAGKLKSHSGCKMDAACKTFSTDQSLVPTLSLGPLPTAHMVLPHPASFVLAHAPDGLWRPPQVR